MDLTITRTTNEDSATIAAFYVAHQGPLPPDAPWRKHQLSNEREQMRLVNGTRRVECRPCGAILLVESE